MALESLVSGPACLWELIDEFYLDVCEDWKTRYVELQNAPVIIAETYNPEAMPLPAMVISSYDRDAGGDQAVFGDGQYHMAGLTYDYQLIVCAAFATVADAKRFSANAAASLLAELRLQIDGIVELKSELDDEYVVRFELGSAELYIRGIAGQPVNGNYTGCCVLAITVYSEV
jgi:hypothetical protein